MTLQTILEWGTSGPRNTIWVLIDPNADLTQPPRVFAKSDAFLRGPLAVTVSSG